MWMTCLVLFTLVNIAPDCSNHRRKEKLHLTSWKTNLTWNGPCCLTKLVLVSIKAIMNKWLGKYPNLKLCLFKVGLRHDPPLSSLQHLAPAPWLRDPGSSGRCTRWSLPADTHLWWRWLQAVRVDDSHQEVSWSHNVMLAIARRVKE